MITVCVDIMLHDKSVQSLIIFSLLCSIIVDTFEVDPTQFNLKNAQRNTAIAQTYM